MESYYSSDEEIAWGPLTLREIKKELQKMPKRMNRRETDCGYYSCLEANSKAAPENKSNSSGASAYFTPNESLQPDPATTTSDTFLEKLTKVIEGEASEKMETTPYEPVLDTTNVDDANDTLAKILNTEKKYTNNLDNIQQTLVNNTIYSPCNDSEILHLQESTIEEISDDSDDNIIVITDDSSDESVEHVYEPVELLVKVERQSEIVNKTNHEKLPELDEDADSEDITDLILELKKVKELQQCLGSEMDGSRSEECEDICPEDTPDHDSLQPELTRDEDFRVGHLEGEECEDAPSYSIEEEEALLHSRTEDDHSSHLEPRKDSRFEEEPTENSITEEKDKLQEPTDDLIIEEEEEGRREEESEPIQEKENGLDISGIRSFSMDQDSNSHYLENPAPSLASTDSGNKSDSLVFNDTLEEMEMILKQGLAFRGPAEEVSSDTSSVNNEPVTLQKVTSVQKKQIPVKTPLKKFNYVQSPIGEYIRNQRSPDIFKLPLKPPKTKLTPNPRSPQVHGRPFKNIVSPIGVYIKNSPGCCLKQNIPVRTVASLRCEGPSEVVRTNQENVTSELPEVIYKPAKKVVSDVKKDIVLPRSIQKLVAEPTVTKHETRVKRLMNNSTVSKKLLEDDLTTTSVDGSLLADDVSFVTVQQAFIK